MRMALPLTWGATPAEVRRPYAADHLVDDLLDLLVTLRSV